MLGHSRQINVNARNGTVAMDITSTQMKRVIRAGWKIGKRRVVMYDIEGFTRPGPDLPNDEVALSEVSTRPTHTYVIHITLYTED